MAPKPTAPSTSSSCAIAGHLSDKDEAMALRSLELWGRAMAAIREARSSAKPPRQAADRPTGKGEPQ